MSTRRGGGGGGGGGSVSTGTGGTATTSTPRSSVNMGGNKQNTDTSTMGGYSMSGNTAGGASIEYSSAPVTHRGGMGGMGGMGGGGMDISLSSRGGGTPKYHYNNNNNNNNMSSTSIIPPPINMTNSQYYDSRNGNGGGGTWLQFCCECYDPRREMLEYDYALDEKNDAAGNATANVASQQAPPRTRARGEYYIDSYNDQPWSWTFGTAEKVRHAKKKSSSSSSLSILVLFHIRISYRPLALCQSSFFALV
jgi:hypothetical protein